MSDIVQITFWEVFEKICYIKDVAPYAVIKELKISTAEARAWKRGEPPEPLSVTLIEGYFDIKRPKLSQIVDLLKTDDGKFSLAKNFRKTVNSLLCSTDDVELAPKQMNEDDISFIRIQLNEIRKAIDSMEDMRRKLDLIEDMLK